MNDQLMIEISNLKFELSNLQSIHKLDQIKAENTEKRLKRHILSLEEDANESSNEAMKIRMESEKAIEKLNQARRIAVNEAREWREKFLVQSEYGSSEGNNCSDEDLELVSRENEFLKKKVTAMEEEINSLRSSLLCTTTSSTSANEKVEAGLLSPEKNKKQSSDEYDNDDDDENKITPLSPAPPAVLSELNRTRVKLSESERTVRQLTRTNRELETQADRCNIYEEKAKSYENRIEILEHELKQLRRERESLRIVESRWTDFRKELVKQSLYKEGNDDVEVEGSSGTRIKNNRSRSSSADEENVPPEIATIIRHLTNLRDQLHILQNEKNEYHSKLASSNQKIQSLEKELDNSSTNNKALLSEKKKIEDLQKRTDQELKIIQAQEGIAKREVSSMRLLLDTYKQMEFNLSGGNEKKRTPIKKEAKVNNDDDPTISGLKVSLNSANDQVTLLRQQYEESKNERDGFEKEKDSMKEENARIRKKFEQLREALYKEKERAEQAEAKAFEAETIAGKGSFNPDTTRVLHLENNPMATAVRTKYESEIKQLKEELKALSDSKSKSQSKGKSQVSELDAKKLNKRLKEHFRAQIGQFREGVHLLTGYKIDMVADLDRPRFKVRSMYAENESDVLEFIWPKLEEGQSPVSLDILNTKMAQMLSNEPCFEYMKRYNSLPAFMASVCLSLFEKQTMV